nr:7-deoxyloganetin glucosyltransferase [Quercus suber]
MLKLAKLLHHKGFYVTFVNTEYNHKRLLRSRGPNSFDGLLDFHFETIPDGLPPSDADVGQEIPSLSVSISKNGLLPLCNLISKLNNTSSWDRPPVTSIISEGYMSFTLDIAEKFGIPNVLFWTPSSCGFLGYMHYRHLVERGLTPLKDIIIII